MKIRVKFPMAPWCLLTSDLFLPRHIVEMVYKNKVVLTKRLRQASERRGRNNFEINSVFGPSACIAGSELQSSSMRGVVS